MEKYLEIGIFIFWIYAKMVVYKIVHINVGIKDKLNMERGHILWN